MNNSPSWVRFLTLPLVLSLAALMGPAGPVGAAPLAPTTLTLTAPASGKAGLQVPFTATLTDQASAPIAGARVAIQRLDSRWATVRSGTTDSAGQVRLGAALPLGAKRWRASYAGNATQAPSLSPEIRVTGVRYASILRLTGPTRLVDETTAT